MFVLLDKLHVLTLGVSTGLFPDTNANVCFSFSADSFHMFVDGNTSVS